LFRRADHLPFTHADDGPTVRVLNRHFPDDNPERPATAGFLVHLGKLRRGRIRLSRTQVAVEFQLLAAVERDEPGGDLHFRHAAVTPQLEAEQRRRDHVRMAGFPRRRGIKIQGVAVPHRFGERADVLRGDGKSSQRELFPQELRVYLEHNPSFAHYAANGKAANPTASPSAIKATPVAFPTSAPCGTIFSTKMTPESTPIHTRFIVPMTNSTSIKLQQQPRQ